MVIFILLVVAFLFQPHIVVFADYNHFAPLPSITSTAYFKNQLFYIENFQLHTYNIEKNESNQLLLDTTSLYLDEEKSETVDPRFDLAVSSNNTLYLLDSSCGHLYPLCFKGENIYVELPIKLDWDMLETANVTMTYDSFIMGDGLYLFMEGNQLGEGHLYYFNIQNGKGKLLLSSKEVKSISPYISNKLLTLSYNMSEYNQNQEDEYLPVIQIYDPSTLEFGTKLTHCSFIPAAGLAYNAKNDTIYLTGKDGIYKQVGQGIMELVGHLPITMLTKHHSASLLDDGSYVYRDLDGFYIRNVTGTNSAEEKVLTIYGQETLKNQGYGSFLNQHPNTQIVSKTQSNMSESEIYKQILLGSSDDIFSFFDSSSIQLVKEKGFYFDLSVSQYIKDRVEQMYPLFSEQLKNEDAIAAIPIYVYDSFFLSYNERALSKVNTPTESMPKTFMELLEFIELWNSQSETIDLFSRSDIPPSRDVILKMILINHFSMQEMNQEPYSLDAPYLQALLIKLDEISPKLESLVTQGNLSEGGTAFSSVLKISSNSLSSDSSEHIYSPLLLSLDTNFSPIFPCVMSVLTVNPNTASPNLAVAYLEETLKNNLHRLNVRLYPDANELVEKSNYITQMAEITNKKNMLQKLASTLPDDEKESAFVDEWVIIKQTEDHLNKPELHYEVTPNKIEQYRSIVPFAWVGKGEQLVSSSEISHLVSRYGKQEIDYQNFISEGNRILQMMAMED